MKYLYQRNNGIITKYEQLSENIKDGNIYIDTSTNILVNKDEVLLLGKVEENIIDLIEEGDYVNGYKITDKISDYLYTEVLTLNGDYKTICDYQIESIVTKEQFSSVEYRLE